MFYAYSVKHQDVVCSRCVKDLNDTFMCSSHGKHIYLSADVFLSQTQLSKIKEYLLNTYDKRFKGHSIAVLGDWEIVKKYHIRCNVQSPKNVIYKFVYDV